MLDIAIIGSDVYLLILLFFRPYKSPHISVIQPEIIVVAETITSTEYLDRWNRNSNGEYGVFEHGDFEPRSLEKAVLRLLQQRPTTGNGNMAA